MARYCPDGHGMFDDALSKCPVCQKPLVSTPPAAAAHKPRRTNEPIVYLATAPNEITAQMWLEVLRDGDIKGLAKPLGPGMGAWASVATMEHAIYVLQSDHEAARALIEAIENLNDNDQEETSPFSGPRH